MSDHIDSAKDSSDSVKDLGDSAKDSSDKNVFDWCFSCQNANATESHGKCIICLSCIRATLSNNNIDIPRPQAYEGDDQ